MSTGPRNRTAARAVSEVFSPITLVMTQLFAVAVHATGSLRRGLFLGAVTAFFAVGLPYATLLVGLRLGILDDRHLSERRQRRAVMAVALASVSTGLLVTWWLGAPRALFAVVAAVVAGVTVSLAVTVFWKISVHTAGAAGTVAVLVLEFGPALWAALPVVAVVAWARVVLRAHTPAQVAAGAVIGFLIAAGVMAGLR